MPLELSHIGEELVARMLSEISRGGELGRVCCAMSGRSFLDDVQSAGLREPLDFWPNKAALRVRAGGGDYPCDGAQTIDVLCAGGQHAIAVEAKLGTALMSFARFHARFRAPCSFSRHPDRRLRGNMIAVLERSIPEADPRRVRLTGEVEGREFAISRTWWLVLRRSVLERWRAGWNDGSRIRFARLVAIETLVEAYGCRRFDELVFESVGKDFCRRWNLG